MSKEFSVGQVWTYPNPEGFEDSRIIIGAVETIEDNEIVCIAVTAAPVPRRKGLIARATIPFLPFSKSAIEATVLELDDQSQDLPDEFEGAFAAWKGNPQGLDFFQVPFPTLLSEIYYALQDENSPLNETNT